MSIIGEGEPWSREGLVISAIRAAWQPDSHAATPLNSREPTMCGGVALSDRFVTRMEIIDALHRLQWAEPQQAAVLVLLHGEDRDIASVARTLHTDRNAVANAEAIGLTQLCRWLWDEPTYQSPPRCRPRRSVLPFVERLSRKRAV